MQPPTRKKREKYEGFLKSVALFATVDEYEMTKIMDAVKPVQFKAGDQIITEVYPFYFQKKLCKK